MKFKKKLTFSNIARVSTSWPCMGLPEIINRRDSLTGVSQGGIYLDCDGILVTSFRLTFSTHVCSAAGSLADMMTVCRQTLTEAQIAVVMRMALLGLQYLHGRQILHRWKAEDHFEHLLLQGYQGGESVDDRIRPLQTCRFWCVC